MRRSPATDPIWGRLAAFPYHATDDPHTVSRYDLARFLGFPCRVTAHGPHRGQRGKLLALFNDLEQGRVVKAYCQGGWQLVRVLRADSAPVGPAPRQTTPLALAIDLRTVKLKVL